MRKVVVKTGKEDILKQVKAGNIERTSRNANI